VYTGLVLHATLPSKAGTERHKMREEECHCSVDQQAQQPEMVHTIRNTGTLGMEGGMEN
jgi:hypothetical protein